MQEKLIIHTGSPFQDRRHCNCVGYVKKIDEPQKKVPL